ncbi:hypothetical protein FBU30_009466, partial [Linnemannia zychae]
MKKTLLRQYRTGKAIYSSPSSTTLPRDTGDTSVKRSKKATTKPTVKPDDGDDNGLFSLDGGEENFELDDDFLNIGMDEEPVYLASQPTKF